ncbi:hypothetical protein QL285_041602 [Trifolium repens]|nr:hypothetical protein QL285_041602 [Trifolium repens]
MCFCLDNTEKFKINSSKLTFVNRFSTVEEKPETFVGSNFFSRARVNSDIVNISAFIQERKIENLMLIGHYKSHYLQLEENPYLQKKGLRVLWVERV